MNLLVLAYDLGIADAIHKIPRINQTFADRYVKRLVAEHGVTQANAEWVVSLWCICYGAHTLKKPCEIQSTKSGAAEKKAESSQKSDIQTYGDLFRYEHSTSGNGLAVAGFHGESKKSIIFQSTSKAGVVKEVADDAFAGSEIAEAIFTEGFVKIGRRAFSDCDRLTQVVFPISMKEIGDYAFAGCNSLTTATLPLLLEKIGAYSLSGTMIRNVSIPQTVYALGTGAFSSCILLSKVDIPQNITSIPDYLFFGCSNLKRVDLHERVTSIGDHAFDGCTELDSIYIPDSVKEIGENAFQSVHSKFILMCSFGSYAERYARAKKLKYQFV